MKMTNIEMSSVILTETLRHTITELYGFYSDNSEEYKELQKLCNLQQLQSMEIIPFETVRKVHKTLIKCKGEKTPYLHELLEGSEVYLPSPPQPERNSELEARIHRLRREQEERVYRKMTEDVSASAPNKTKDTYSHDVKEMNKQLTHFFNFTVTIVAAFAFGYVGSDMILGTTDVATKMFTGLALAAVVFTDDLYFLIRTFE